MTAEEAKNGLYQGTPVTYNGIRYEKITAIIYRISSKGELIVSAQLLDKSKNSVIVARIKDIEILTP